MTSGQELSPVDGALLIASYGCSVARFPLGSKISATKGWKAQATNDPNRIRTLFGGARCNVAVLTDGKLIVDVDIYKGHAEWPLLKELPPTFTIRSARGGLHYYFNRPEGSHVYGSASNLAPGVDIRADGSHVMGPGSTFEGQPYTVIDQAPIAMAPGWLIELLQTSRQPKADNCPVGELDTTAAIESARSYLQTAPEAIEGCGGNETTYKVSCSVKDRGVSKETCVDLMLEHYNPRCRPEWSVDELESIVSNAFEYGQAAPGRDNPAAGFCVIELPRKITPRLLKFARDISMDAIKERATNATIKGLFGPKEIIISYGESTAAKTFGVSDRAWRIALGLEWMGRKTKRCPVLYVCLEGEHGFEKRMEALKNRYGDPGNYFATLNVPVTLIRNPAAGAEGVKTIIAAFNELIALTGETTGHIVLDTLSRAIAGDNENSAEDIMHFIAHRVDPIRHETGASFEIIHHTNKMGDIRGSSSLKPAVDCMMRFDREGDIRTVTAEKVKDGEDNVVVQTFTLEQVRLGIDDDGVPITSCIVKPCEPRSVTSKAKPAKEGKGCKALRAAFASATAKRLLTDVIDPETGKHLGRMTHEALRSLFYEAYRGDSTAMKRRAFGRVLDSLPLGFKSKSIGGVDHIWLDDADWPRSSS